MEEIEEETRHYCDRIEKASTIDYFGRVIRVTGLTIEADGPGVRIGDICLLESDRDDERIPAEVVGFQEKKILLMPFGDVGGVAPGCRVTAYGGPLRVPIGDDLLGRVLDGLGRPLDNHGELRFKALYPTANTPPNPLQRQTIETPLSVGVKAIDGLLTCGRGQRMGIFSGSGVGKSTLLGMIARNTEADVNVIALVGERGREVRNFLEQDLGEEGLERSVVVAATSDQPAMLRIKAAEVATSIAEYFRDTGRHVMLMMDSVTRFALAQREVGLAIGEPPANRGFTPSVFAELPKLLERAGTAHEGSITGFYTILIDGDDPNEPISDHVRGILDGHILLSRDLASSNHYPAIDVLHSLSRLMDEIVSPQHRVSAGAVRSLLATYREAEDLINVGAYEDGADHQIDEAKRLIAPVRRFLKQEVGEAFTYEETREELLQLAGRMEEHRS